MHLHVPLFSSFLLGHWGQKISTPPGGLAAPSPFCPGDPTFHIDFTGTMLSHFGLDNKDVEVCVSSSSEGMRLPLYTDATFGCDSLDETKPAMYVLQFQRALPFTFGFDRDNTFPPSQSSIQFLFNQLFLDPELSLHVIGDSHQRYLYCGLADLANHNCSTTYINPKYLQLHNLRKEEIEKWYPTHLPIHITTGNFGFSKYNLPKPGVKLEKTFNQTLYEKIEALALCAKCVVVMNVGIHDMTTHTQASYKQLHPLSKESEGQIFARLESEFRHNLEQFLRYVIKMGLSRRFVWVSGTPYEEEDTNWKLLMDDIRAKNLLRGNERIATKTNLNRMTTQKMSRFFRTFLFTKELCEKLQIPFLDIYHPLSGPGFDELRIPGDVHKKRFTWRMKAALLLNGLVEKLSSHPAP